MPPIPEKSDPILAIHVAGYYALRPSISFSIASLTFTSIR